MPEVSVVLCSFNRAAKVARCLEALARQTIPKERYEVICVNDGSSDQTAEVMQRGLEGLQGKYLEHSSNRALAAARNSGIRAASGQIVVFINDDTYPAENFLFEHYFAHCSRPGEKIAVLGFIPFCPEYANRFFSVLLMEHNLYFPFQGMNEKQQYSFSHFVGGNLSLRRDAFVANDIWFDETFQCYGYEDIECGYRLAKCGYSVLYHPQARVVHDHKVTVQEYCKRANNNAVNIVEMLIRHPELRQSVLGVERVSASTIQLWREQVADLRDGVEKLSAELEVLQEQPLSGLAPARQEEQEVLSRAAEALQVIREYHEKQGYISTISGNERIYRELAR